MAKRMRRSTDEDVQQKRLVADLRADPDAPQFFHVPNGGFRHASVAADMKAMGTSAGVPDLLFVTEPRTAIELKNARGTGRVSAEQKAWLNYLESQGWLCFVCNGYSAALKILKEVYGWQPKKKKFTLQQKSKSRT